MVRELRIAVLASGQGTDLQSIIDASEKQMIDADVVVVLSDKKEAYALKRARHHTIPAFFVDPKHKTREEHEHAMTRILKEHNVELIVEAGYMRLLTPSFVKQWYGELINIHPALLPSFKGVDGQGDALAYGVRISGCTTHFTDEDMDHGPIILQAAIKVKPQDTRDDLASRILAVEHQILPRTIQLFAEGRLTIHGRSVLISPGDSWLDKYPRLDDVLYGEGY
ncbi:MAG: phosphoribosylglycinamide formyltransferase [Candidatus Thermoplasmatota archaeon]|nr:phosphoribosylglycinamide formyltransferase [Candidatus Thermoplasmatota archaeon]MBU1940541.1 phosphoribosylglycinamide formyltransferase [Candidatus Thermoplasmatota archaeon]